MVTEKGYLTVTLSKDGKFKHYKIHRLVAEAYLDNPNNYPDVHHINNIRTDNYLGNLRWMSHKENMIYRYVEWLRSFGILVEIPQDFKIKKREVNYYVIYRILRG